VAAYNGAGADVEGKVAEAVTQQELEPAWDSRREGRPPDLRAFGLVAPLLALFLAAAPALAAIPVYGYKVVRVYPHDPNAFTEGLFYRGGYLYESTGLNGQSEIRKEELATAKVVMRRELPGGYFGEGIVDDGKRLIQLTWRNQVGFIYDLKTFAPEGQFAYSGEGWALTSDGRRIIMSDGTPVLRFLDPKTLKETGRVNVTADGQPVQNVNELEWVKGEVFANIWMTSRIARIDPATGKVVGWIDLTGIISPAEAGADPDNVANGIAYDAARDRLFVTGKRWPKLFQIRLVRKP
jgi:glutaminyl-peptide cyclotransferase